jgi:phenylacetate-CoA ligase
MYPALVSRVIFPLHERLKGKSTYQKLAELERTQWLAPVALRALQLERLRRHLEWAYREVPYYRRLLDDHGMPPRQVQTFEDFARIPPLTKDILRERLVDLQPRTPLRGVQRLSTGGSTGAPVTVFVDRERAAFTDAARLARPSMVLAPTWAPARSCSGARPSSSDDRIECAPCETGSASTRGFSPRSTWARAALAR